MKKKKKETVAKRVTAALLACICTCAVTACGSKTESRKSSGGVEKITMYVPGDQQPDQEMVQEAWNEYLREKMNVELDIKVISWGDWNSKKSTALSANEDIDLMWIDGGSYYNDMAKNAYAELDGLLDEYGQELKAAINPLYLEGAKFNGKLYMIPTNKEIAVGRAIWFRTDLLEKYNLTVDEDMTLQDFDPIFKTIKENEPDVAPADTSLAWYGATNGKRDHQYDFTQVPGSDYLYLENATGKVYSMFDLDWATEQYYVYHDYRTKGYMSDDVLDGRVTREDNMKSGHQLTITGNNKPYEAAVNRNRFGLSEDMTMAAAIEPVIDTTSATGAGLAIVSYSPRKETAMKVINALWTDPELMHLVQDGIEGRHYIKNTEEKYWKTLPEQFESSTDTGYAPTFFWEFGNEMENLFWDTEPADKHEKFQEFNESSYISPLFGFYFTTDNIKTELAAISNIYTTYSDLLEYAKTDDVTKTLDELRGKMKAAGIDKVIAEVEKQYAEWVAKQ